MSSLFLPVTCLVAVALGAFVLLLACAKADGEDAGLALIGTIAFMGGAAGLALWTAMAYLHMPGGYGEGPPWWLDAPLRGAILGLAIYLAWHLWNGVKRILPWACRRPNEDKTIGFRPRRHACTAAAVAVVCTATIVIDRMAPSSDGPYSVLEWLALIVIFSAVPLCQTWVWPWFFYYRSRRLDAREHGEIHEWLEHVRETRGVPRFHLRVREGNMVNAIATGGVRAHFIVLGRGLLEHLKPQHVKAVLAREIGHVVNGDTFGRTVPLILCCVALHLLYYHFVALRLEGFWPQGICIAIGILFFLVILPSLFQYRWEYQADRKAVEIMGDAEVVARALERIYDANNAHVNAPGWPHPPLRARLKAIGVAATR